MTPTQGTGVILICMGSVILAMLAVLRYLAQKKYPDSPMIVSTGLLSRLIRLRIWLLVVSAIVFIGLGLFALFK